MKFMVISILSVVTIIVSLIYAAFYVHENAPVYAYVVGDAICSDYVSDTHTLTGCISSKYNGMFQILNANNILKIQTNK